MAIKVSRTVSLLAVLGGVAAPISGCGDGGADATDGGGSSAQAELPSFNDPTTIDNPFLPLTERGRCELRGEENGDRIRITRTLLERTEPFTVAGSTVEAAVIEDREYENAEIVERVLDYFAQGDDGTVYYLGKDVDNYEGGKVVNHEGRFRYGHDTNTLGVAMPADPQVGDRWEPEVVGGKAARLTSMVGRASQVEIQGQTYDDLIRVRETEPPSKEAEFKLYASGTGLVRELPPGGRIELIGCL